MELTIFNSDIGKTRMSITTAYISHGGGPLPLLENSIGTGGVGDANHQEMIEVLNSITLDIQLSLIPIRSCRPIERYKST